jgi:hypothetical protein
MYAQFRIPLVVIVLIGLCLAADEKKDAEKKEPAERGGTIVGVITAKGENFIEVKADGEEKGRRYVPEWVGGAPAQGGGPNKDMLKTIKELQVGSRVKLEWKFEERPRVIKVEVLKKADAKGETKKEEAREEEKKGTAIGTLTAKGDSWVELKADGEEKARRYVLHFGGTKELLAAIRDTPVNSRVRIDWIHVERLRVLKMEAVKQP